MHLQRYEHEREAFLRRIIAIDETWAKTYEPECQSNEWRQHGSPRKQTIRPTPTNVKVMLILAYDWDGVIVNHTVPRGQTVNAAYYCSFLQDHLLAALRRKRCHYMVTPPIVLHDNARAHTAGVVPALLNRWGWEVLYHPPPYSPDISPCEYYLILKMKMPMRGKRYCTIEDIKQAAERSLRIINRLGSANGIQ